MFENTVMNSKFTKWMASSKCVFWFGCSSDTSKDDKTNGTGYTWTRNNGSLSQYPFVRVWWKAGKVDKAASGDYWDGASSKGYDTFIKKLNSLLKNYKPDATTTITTTTTTTTTTTEPATPETPADGGTVNEGDCAECKPSDDCQECKPCDSECTEKLAKANEKIMKGLEFAGSAETAVNAALEAVKSFEAQLGDVKTALLNVKCALSENGSCNA